MEITLPTTLGYGRLDSLLKVFGELRGASVPRTGAKGTQGTVRLNWSRVQQISPAGHAMLACLFDSAAERQYRIEHKHIKKKFRELPVVKNLLELSNHKRLSKLPKPSTHNQRLDDSLLAGQDTLLNLTFIEELIAKFGNLLSEDLLFSCRLILNELMQNSIDHSGAERYYLYAGVWRFGRTPEVPEIHVGVLDMGVTIPAKLQQKYDLNTDPEYLDLALREGVTTRRSRPGGLGLFHTFEHLKNHEGTLTLISRNAQLTRYFRNKKIRREPSKFSLEGTWCMARFPIVLEGSK